MERRKEDAKLVVKFAERNVDRTRAALKHALERQRKRAAELLEDLAEGRSVPLFESQNLDVSKQVAECHAAEQARRLLVDSLKHLKAL